MANIFLKDDTRCVKDLVSNIYDVNEYINSTESKNFSNIENKSTVIMGLVSAFGGFLLQLSFPMVFNVVHPSFLVLLFGLVGVLAGMCLGLGLGKILQKFNKELKIARKKKNDYKSLFLKLLSTEDFQKELIYHLNYLEENRYTSSDNKSFLTKFKMDIISFFYENKIQEALDQINTHLQLLDSIIKEISIYEKKEIIVEHYMFDKKLKEESKSHSLAKSGLQFNYDYRKQV